jgi:hypothetical protein
MFHVYESILTLSLMAFTTALLPLWLWKGRQATLPQVLIKQAVVKLMDEAS